MADDAPVRRTLHLRFTLPGASGHVIAMMKSAEPLLAMFHGAKVTLLQNVDDPNRFIQVIDYEMPGSLESNRQQIAADPRVQTYLQAWRAMFPGSVEIDVYKEA